MNDAMKSLIEACNKQFLLTKTTPLNHDINVKIDIDKGQLVFILTRKNRTIVKQYIDIDTALDLAELLTFSVLEARGVMEQVFQQLEAAGIEMPKNPPKKVNKKGLN